MSSSVPIHPDNSVPKNLVAYDMYTKCFGYAYTFYGDTPLTQAGIEEAYQKQVDLGTRLEVRVHPETLAEYGKVVGPVERIVLSER
jgi:hypothetical protein